VGGIPEPTPHPVSGPGWVWSKEAGYDLPDEAYRQPTDYDQITDAKAYREIMLNRNGEILAAGRFWKIVGQSLGHSLVSVSLVRKEIPS
jgi:hypothetical protein